MALVLTLAQRFSTRRMARIAKHSLPESFSSEIQVVYPNHVSINQSPQSIWPQHIYSDCQAVTRAIYKM